MAAVAAVDAVAAAEGTGGITEADVVAAAGGTDGITEVAVASVTCGEFDSERATN